MHWEKKICFRINMRRIVGTILITSILVNLAIVGVVFGETSFAPIPTLTPLSEIQPSIAASITPVPVQSETLASTPTLTSTVMIPPTDTPAVAPTLAMCILNSYWPIYYVQQGDTLASLARATGSSVEELVRANCLPDDQIHPGQSLYVPRSPVITSRPTFSTLRIIPTNTPSITPSDTPTVTQTNTTDVRTIFQNPYAELLLCSDQSDNFYISVTPSNPQGISSVTAFYSINTDTWNEIPMRASGDSYYGSTYVSGEYASVDRVNFYFVAIDGLEKMTESLIYSAYITPCQALQQAK